MQRVGAGLANVAYTETNRFFKRNGIAEEASTTGIPESHCNEEG